MEPSSGNCFTYLSLDLVPIPQETLQGDHVIQSDIMQVEPSETQSVGIDRAVCSTPSMLSSTLPSSPLSFCVLHSLTQLRHSRIHHRQLPFVLSSSFLSATTQAILQQQRTLKERTLKEILENFKGKTSTRCSPPPPSIPGYLHRCSPDPCRAESLGCLGRAH